MALQDPIPGWIGIVNTCLNPATVVQSTALHVQELCEMTYGVAPDFTVSTSAPFSDNKNNNDNNTTDISTTNDKNNTSSLNSTTSPVITIPYIGVHLEYILTELFKNANRATVEHSRRIRRVDIPPIEVTIAKGEEDVMIRIRDQGGGISASGNNFYHVNYLISVN